MDKEHLARQTLINLILILGPLHEIPRKFAETQKWEFFMIHDEVVIKPLGYFFDTSL